MCCRLGFERSRAHVIPYGVDVEQFSPAPVDPPEWRQRLGIPEDAVVVLGVGRMVTKKGFHVLLDEVEGLLSTHPSVHLVLGGSGDRLEEFQERTNALRDRVHLPGVVYRDSLPDLYRSADVFVLPAVHDRQGNVDGLPNVILEAMASGLPVVASGISGIPLAIENGREGLLVEERDGHALVEALGKIIDSSTLRVEMGAAARRRAETDLTWKAVSARYREAYESVVAASTVEAQQDA